MWHKRLVIEMNKVILALSTILCLLSASFLIPCRIQAVKAASLPVPVTVDDDGPADFNTIQGAINNVSAGSTILVRNGLYVENVVVNKSVSVIGESNVATIVDGNRTGSVFNITNTDNVHISNFTVRNSNSLLGFGIALDHCSGNTISNNRIAGNRDGIGLSFSYNNIVRYNNLSLNYFSAVDAELSAGNVFSYNFMSGNSYGIKLSTCDYNVFSGNILHSTGDGITLWKSSGNTISGNSVTENNYGITAVSCNNNGIYQNNFINNTSTFFFQESNNTWDNGVEGNYWSDYFDKDIKSGPYQNETGSDGIWDTPRTIDSGRDDYPLMGPLTDFVVVSAGKEYHVMTISNSTIMGFRFELGPETGNRIVVFNTVNPKSAGGFCRMTISNEFMRYPYVMLMDDGEVSPTLLGVSNSTYACIYFAYSGQNRTVTIISSRVQNRYDELLVKYLEVQANLTDLNLRYYVLLSDYLMLQSQLSSLNGSYNDLSNSYRILQTNLNNISSAYDLLNASYRDLGAQLLSLSVLYDDLFSDYLVLQTALNVTNVNYLAILNNYATLQATLSSLTVANINLLNNYSRLREGFNELNASYAEHLSGYTQQTQNLRNMLYLFSAISAVFIVTTVYLSKSAHHGKTAERKALEEKESTE